MPNPHNLTGKVCPKCGCTSSHKASRCPCGHWIGASASTTAIPKRVVPRSTMPVICIIAAVMMIASMTSWAIKTRMPLDIAFVSSVGGLSTARVRNTSQHPVYGIYMTSIMSAPLPVINELDSNPRFERFPITCSSDRGDDPVTLQPGDEFFITVNKSYFEIDGSNVFIHFRTSPDGNEISMHPGFKTDP